MLHRHGHAVAALLALALLAINPSAPSHGDDDPATARAKKIVAQMTLQEKVNMVHGNQSLGHHDRALAGFVGLSAGCQRLSVPALAMNDGPQGFRAAAAPGTSTQFPSGLTAAQSFNRSLMHEFGQSMGREFAAKGCDVQFGPGLNVARLPWGGRNFEYLSGEDPFLGHELAREVVEGIQSQGVIANPKHFFNNNQENDRHLVSENVDERTQMEIYMPPFEGAVQGGALSMMCANNRINQSYSCENHHAIQQLLRGVVGFQGWMLSDYQGTRSTVQAANNGLDQQMPGCERPDDKDPLVCDSDHVRPNYFGQPLIDAVQNGSVAESTVDDKVVRIVRSMILSGALDRKRDPAHNASTNATSPAQADQATRFAMQAAVLLKNQNSLLPLSPSHCGNTAVIGKAASADGAITGGGGSGAVTPSRISTVLAAVRARLGEDRVSFDDGSDVDRAAQVAAKADLAIVVTATSSHEGADRTTLALPEAELLAAVGKAQRHTITVVVAPGQALLRPWLEDVAAIVYLGMPGQGEGEAFAQLAFNESSVVELGCPCGRLPFTMPNTENDMNFTEAMYPGINHEADYSERLNVGYRWYNAHNVTPVFPFGFGLSYTSFGFGSLHTSKSGDNATVSFTVTNTGHAPGTAVAQLYLSFPKQAGEPPQQLKGFDSIFLGIGESKEVSMVLTGRAFSTWDVDQHQWKMVHGQYSLSIGTSVRDIVLSTTVTV